MRTQAEVDAYVAELTKSAAEATARARALDANAAEIKAQYFDVTDMTKMYPGMVKYRDVRGQRLGVDSWDELPDGVINKDFDRIQLSKRTIWGGFNLNLGADWKGLTFQARISANWGGYSKLPVIPTLSGMNGNQTNYPIYWIGNVYQPFDVLDDKGNVVAPANVNAIYPNVALPNTTEDSEIWRIPSFRMSLGNASLGYTLPRKLVEAASLSAVRVTLTGTNLFSFFNPYPEKYVDPLASGNAYSTLRVISLGVNVTF
jgi:hypothetical protein